MPRPLRILRNAGSGQWEMTIAEPHVTLRAYGRRYVQAHFDRDVRAFAGATPTELLRSLGPDGGFSTDR